MKNILLLCVVLLLASCTKSYCVKCTVKHYYNGALTGTTVGDEHCNLDEKGINDLQKELTTHSEDAFGNDQADVAGCYKQ